MLNSIIRSISKTITLAAFFLLLQTACEPQPKPIDGQAAVQAGYQKLLQQKWIDLNSREEWLLQVCIEKEADGGAEVKDLRYQDEEADKMVANKLLRWDSDARRYKATTMGKDVYALGMKLREEESKKDPRFRSARLIKNASNNSPGSN